MSWPQEFHTTATMSPGVIFEADGRKFLVGRKVTLFMTGAGDQPDAEAECEIVNGVPEVRRLTFVAKPKGRPIQGAHLRALNMDLAVKAFQLSADEVTETAPDEFEWVGPASAEPQRSKAAKSGLKASAELRRVADAYLKNVDRPGGPRAAVQALGFPERTADRRIKQAEEAGLLPPTTPGKKRGTS